MQDVYGKGFNKEKKRAKRKPKTDRRMKVYYSSGSGYYDLIPTIRLSGAWVRELGFQIGTQIMVHCEAGKLTITLAEGKEEAV